MVTAFFGFPGCGKTSLVAKTAVNAQRRIDQGLSCYKHVYCNVPITYPGIRLIKFEWLGMYDYSDSIILIDEIGINAHCRSYDSFPLRIVEWFALHRHYRCDVFYFGQYYNQADKTLREVTERLYYMRRSILPHFTRITKIPKRILIPKETGDIKEGYRLPNLLERLFIPGTSKFFYRKPYYQYFNSWEVGKKLLPAKYTVLSGKACWIDQPIGKVVKSVRKLFRSRQSKV